MPRNIEGNFPEQLRHLKPPTKKPAKTPREILSFVSSIWDPLGLVSPFVILGRVFLQGLWPLKLDWDDVIDEEKLHGWTKFKGEAK